MFRSISKKLVAIFITVIILSFSVVGIALYYILDYNAFSSKTAGLEQSADWINNVFDYYQQYMTDPFTSRVIRNFITNQLDREAHSANSIIWVINTKGQVAYSDSSDTTNFLLQKIRKIQTGIPQLPDDRQYQKVISGEEPEIKDQHDFFGLFSGNVRLTVEKPLVITNNNGTSQIRGAVILSTPVPQIRETRASVFRYYIVSLIISVFISIILVSLLSRRIIKPLKEINEAAKVITSGDFDKKLDIRSKDEIGELATSFNQMVSALENLEKMRRDFIANVSHEIRTPMTSIKGFIDGILDGTIPPEKQQFYLTIVRDESARLNKMVNDLLDLAKIEAGEMKLSMYYFDINELLRRCIINLEQLIVSKEIQVEADFEQDETVVFADRDAIERVVLNLLHNAVKFTPPGGVITVSTRELRDMISVSVKDTGAGMEREELVRIWDRFYKSDKSRSFDKSGTGLGLSIVKSIISEHHQDIKVESEPGKGTTFTFTLSRGQREQRSDKIQKIQDSSQTENDI